MEQTRLAAGSNALARPACIQLIAAAVGLALLVVLSLSFVRTDTYIAAAHPVNNSASRVSVDLLPRIRAGKHAGAAIRARASAGRCVAQFTNEQGARTRRYKFSARTRVIRWRSARLARTGRWLLRVRCGRASISHRFRLLGGHRKGHAALVRPGSFRANRIYGPPDPDSVRNRRRAPPGVGGGFAAYLPFPTGFSVLTTQAPGGSVSHNTVWTRDAWDFGAAAGTPVHAPAPGRVYRAGVGRRMGQLRTAQYRRRRVHHARPSVSAERSRRTAGGAVRPARSYRVDGKLIGSSPPYRPSLLLIAAFQTDELDRCWLPEGRTACEIG